MPFERVKLAVGDRDIEIRYRARRDGSFEFQDGSSARVFHWTHNSIDVEIDGRRHTSRVTRAADHLIVQSPRGDVDFQMIPRFTLPGSEAASGGLVAPMPGRVIEVRVAVGDHVTSGQTLILLEAMKMEHPMRATTDGTVSEIRITAGEQVENEALLLVIEPDTTDDTDDSNDR